MVEKAMKVTAQMNSADVVKVIREGYLLFSELRTGNDVLLCDDKILEYRDAVIAAILSVNTLEEENARLKEQVSQLTESLEEASATCTLMKQQQRESWVQPERPAPCARSCEANAFRIKIRELESMLKR